MHFFVMQSCGPERVLGLLQKIINGDVKVISQLD